jgi:hypothetical protein
LEKTYSNKIQEVLLLLASQRDIQLNVFPKYVHVPDEIAMEVSDIVEFAPRENNETDTHILNMFRKINAIFDEMEKCCWTLESLIESSKWQNIRLMAQAEIHYLNLIYRIPNLFWLVYAPISEE